MLWVRQAQAYLDYPPNEQIMETVRTQPYRILPHNEYYALALDADFFKPVFLGNLGSDYYRYDFYHGNGYWLTFRGEFKPDPHWILNLKLNMTHGTSSNGPTDLAQIVPMVGLTYHQNLAGFDLSLRLSDIGRQTTGVGLFIEEKETDGGVLIAKKGDFTYKMMVDGTGSYRLEGGMIANEVSFWNGLMGGVFFIQETAVPNQPPPVMATLYSQHEWPNHLGYGVELGGDENAWAGMIFLKYENEVKGLHYWLKPQIRHYGAGVLGSLPGNVSQVYVSYDQNDKPFTTIMDIFPFGDDVNTFSAQFNLDHRINSFYSWYAETEAVYYQFKQQDAVREVFYRTGFKFYPFKNLPENFGLLIGNKYLIASTTLAPGSEARTFSAPNTPDFENKPLFMKQLYVMANFESKF